MKLTIFAGFWVWGLMIASAGASQSTTKNSSSSGPITVATDPDQAQIEVRFKDRRVLLYVYRANQFKPYVKELYTLGGDNILRDAPPDHAHHHGLMYAIRVNGVNFWEETGQPGYQRPVRLLDQRSSTSDGLAEARFTQLIHWVAAKDKDLSDTSLAALLIERRTLVLSINETTHEVALEWRGDFETSPSNSQITLAGADYHGLGLRLPQPFDRTARFRNSETGEPFHPGPRNVVPAAWTSVSHSIDGREVLVALFGLPARQRGPLNFFTMNEPFAYLSATQGLDKAPLQCTAGQRFTLRYLLTAYSATPSIDALKARYQVWEQQAK